MASLSQQKIQSEDSTGRMAPCVLKRLTQTRIAPWQLPSAASLQASRAVTGLPMLRKHETRLEDWRIRIPRQAASSNELRADHLQTIGLDDEHIVEIIAQLALNIFAGYINLALDVPVDFPKVALK